MTVKKRYIRMTVKKSSPEDAGFTAMEREDAKRLKETKSNAIKVLKSGLTRNKNSFLTFISQV